MKNLSWFINLCVMLLLVGCDNEESSSVLFSEYKTQLPANVWLVQNHSSDEKLYLQDMDSKKVYSVSFDVGNRIAIDTNDFTIKGYAFQFCVIGTDSVIYLPSDEYSSIQLLSFNGIAYDEFRPTYGIPTITPNEKLAYHKYNLYFPNANDTYGVFNQSERKQYYLNTSPVFQLNIENKSQQLWGDFPYSYTHEATNFSNFFPTICPFDDDCILSYQRDHSILLLKNQKLEKSVLCKSKYIKSFLPYPDDKVFDMKYYQNYLFSQPKYSDLIYNHHTKKFYRIAIHEKAITSNGKLVDNTNPTWSIIVMDKNLNIEKEELFFYRQFDPSIIYPTKGGLLVKKAATNNEDKLILAKINL